MKKINVKIPKVIIVGRTNVGKSTLFNRVATKHKGITLDQEGVTRDYLSETISCSNKSFDLIDTGGISLKKQADPILEKIREKVFELFDKASLILFVCDGKNGLTLEDRQIAKTLHKTKKPLWLLINKSDNVKALEDNINDFFALGIKKINKISATHGTGIDRLLEEICEYIPEQTAEKASETAKYRVVILGKPNVGKSSLMNLLTKQERSIVHDQSGTTREAISENIYSSEDIIQVTDTAGIRKKGRVKEELETLMVKSALSAVRTSDIVVIVVDSSEHKLSDQELKLLFYAYENKKSIVLVFNKTDLLTTYDRESLEHQISEYEFILKKIPVLWISCKNKKNVHKIHKEIEKIWERRNQEFDHAEINDLIQEYIKKKPMYHKKQILKIYKVTWVKSNIPTFRLRVNFPEWFKESQLGFVENILRKHYDLKGCPMQFNINKSSK